MFFTSITNYTSSYVDAHRGIGRMKKPKLQLTKNKGSKIWNFSQNHGPQRKKYKRPRSLDFNLFFLYQLQ